MADPFDTIFGRRSVKVLDASDFLLDDFIPIRLKWDDCTLLLLYIDNQESLHLAQVFAAAAGSSTVPFASVNLSRERKVATAFTSMNSKPGAFGHMSPKGYPIIIVYQGGVPVAFYNGERDAQALVDYSQTLACTFGYVELVQFAASNKMDQSIEMGGFNRAPAYTSSVQYTAAQPIRQYDPTTGVVQTGSQASAVEAQRQAQERATGTIGTQSARPQPGTYVPTQAAPLMTTP
jgi:hypothetical protein